jgi:hypothetical protein
MRSTTTSWPDVELAAMTPDERAQRARRNRVLALVHVLLALAILAGFVIAQSQR